MAEDAHIVFALHGLFFVFIVLACLYCDFFIKKNQWYFLPESAASMIVGFLLGGIVVWSLSGTNEADVVKFDATLFFFILLPPIVFEAGYTLDRVSFFSNIGSIVIYAVVGTCISTVIVGYGLYSAAQSGLVPMDSTNALEALLFGSLIAATDPVATLTLLGSPNIGAPQLLYSLVFGEAVLNDAVAIVLYKTFEGFLSVEFTNATIFYAFTKFLFISIGSIIHGFLIAISCSLVFRQSTHLINLPQMEISLVLLFAYSSYFSAEVFGLSGIMSLFFCAIALAHYNYYNLSHKSQHTTHLYFKSLAQVCDTFVFAYLGITIGVSIDPDSGYKLTWSPPLIALTLVLCLVGRAANVFPLSWVINQFREKPISFHMQIAMWFAGLRGAIAFALSLQVPTMHGSEILTTTLSVVIFTTFVCGGLTEPLLRQLGLKNYVEPAPELDEEGRSVDAPRGLARFWLIFDNTYMKRWFGGDIDAYYSLLPVTGEENNRHAHEHHHEADGDAQDASVAAAPPKVKRVRRVRRVRRSSLSEPAEEEHVDVVLH